MRQAAERERIAVSTPCEALPWDSELFGFPIARVTLSSPSRQDLDEAIGWCRRNDIRCLYFLCDAAAVESARSATVRGFDLVDLRVTFGRAVAGSQTRRESRGDVEVRSVGPRDIPALQDLAATSFTETRFGVDRRFPRDRVTSLYRRWIERDAEIAPDLVAVAEAAGSLAGFASAIPVRDDVGQIGLVCVHPAAQGCGVGNIIVEQIVRRLGERGAKEVTVVTSGRNTAAMRLYERSGFTVRSIQIWFHRWFLRRAGRGEPLR